MCLIGSWIILKSITDNVFTDPCFGQLCSGKGVCNVDPSDVTNGYTCICDSGYIGDHCEKGKTIVLLVDFYTYITCFI